MPKSILVATLSVGMLIGMGGCAKPTASAPTTVTPASPADVVAQANDALAKGVSAATTSVIALQKQGVISATESGTLLKYFGQVASASQQVAAIQVANPSWAVEKPQLVALIPTVTLTVGSDISTTGAAYAATVAALWTAFQQAVNQQ
jgi:hypothetical protein